MFIFSSFRSRSQEPEIMDHLSTTKKDFLQAMAEIRWVNRYLNGTACILKPLKQLCVTLPDNIPLTILDLGTASADIPKAIVKWAQKSGRKVAITAVDLHPLAIQEAKRYVGNMPEITVQQGDALQLPIPESSYDFVISSMFLHHLDNIQAVELLQSMAKYAKHGFIINDLERHPMAWLGIRLLGWLTLKGKIFRYDSALSVKRAFVRHELESLCRQSDLPEAHIESNLFFRWVITWEKRLSPDDQG